MSLSHSKPDQHENPLDDLAILERQMGSNILAS